jgi:hypothetical protein
MSMKIFTLSAVCVLIYTLMISLSGVTSLPGYGEKHAISEPEKGPLESASLVASSRTDLPQPRIQNAYPPSERGESQAGVQGKGFGIGTHPIRWAGIVFLLLWVFVSVRLLSTD